MHLTTRQGPRDVDREPSSFCPKQKCRDDRPRRVDPQTESAHISVRFRCLFDIDQTDVSVCRLRFGDRTGRRTVVLAIGIEADRPRPEGAWFTRARPSSKKTKGSNLKYSGK